DLNLRQKAHRGRPCAVLYGSQQPKGGNRPNQAIPPHRCSSQGKEQTPPEEQHGRAYFEDRFRPGLDDAVSEYAEGQQPANANTYRLHCGVRAKAGSGTRATSSTQAVPRILFPNFSLRLRRSTTRRSSVSAPVTNSASFSAHGWVPATFGVKRAGFPG